MQGPTYTSLWRVERRIYRIYDVTLPYAVSLRQIGIFTVILATWVPLMLITGIPITQWWGAAIWLGPPITIAYLTNKPIIENKTLTELLTSELRHQTTSKTIHRLQARKPPPTRTEIRSVVWTRPDPNIHDHDTEAKQPRRIRNRKKGAAHD